MRRGIGYARLVSLVVVCACSEHNAHRAQMDVAQPLASQERADAATTSDAAPAIADVGAWEGAQSFEITLERSACFGSCPQYALRLDSEGRVHLQMKEPFDLRIPVDAVRSLYTDMLHEGFLDMLDMYNDDDGCDEIWTDQPSTIFGLHSPFGVKQVVYYFGCEGSNEALQKLHDLDERIRTLAMVDDLRKLPSTPPDCEQAGAAVSLEPSYRLSGNGGMPVGMLRFTRDAKQRRFIAETCGGYELTRGVVKMQDGCAAKLVIDESEPKRWPGLNGATREILLNPGNRNKPELKAFDINKGPQPADFIQLVWAGPDCLTGGP